jgi:hypothetical protein
VSNIRTNLRCPTPFSFVSLSKLLEKCEKFFLASAGEISHNQKVSELPNFEQQRDLLSKANIQSQLNENK